MKITKLAAIDVGSNAMRMLVNNIYQDEEQTTFNKTSLVRAPIRLGDDAFTGKGISDQNLERMLAAMQAYKLLMEVHGVQDYRAYATSAMREMKDNTSIVKKIKKKTGIELEIIDGKTEAEIIFETELNSYVKDSKNYVYIDVGGGSTEITLLFHGEVKDSISFPIGTVRWLDGKVDESFLTDTVKPWVKENCKGFLFLEGIGSGGNINYMFKYSGQKIGKPITFNYLNKQLIILESLSFNDRLKVYNMKPDRADVIVPALKIYTAIMKYAGIQKIHVPKIGLADGMIQHMYHTNQY